MNSRVWDRCKVLLQSPAAMVGVALLVRLAVLIHAGEYNISPAVDHYNFGFETGRIARAIATGHGFSSPLHGDTGPTAWTAPLYPYLLAGVFKVCGTYSTTSAVVIMVLDCVFSALTCWTVYGLGRRTFGLTVATWAGWLWAFDYLAIHISTHWVWDTCLFTLMLSAIFLLTLKVEEVQDPGPWAGFGLLCGLAILTNTSALSVVPLLLLWLFLRIRKRGGRSSLPLLAGIVIVLTLAPWLVRNYVVFGKVALLRSNFGLELYLGTVEDRPGIGFLWMHPSMNDEEMAKYRQMGELAYMKEKQRLAFATIAQNPRQFAKRSLIRFMEWWFGPWQFAVPRWLAGDFAVSKKMLLGTVTSLLTLTGFLVAIRKREGKPILYGIALIFLPLVYYGVHTSPRYRHAIDPQIILLAVYAVSCVILKFRGRAADVSRVHHA